MKPKVFLSSTCEDLNVIRTELDQFFEERGFEVLNSESASFGVDPGKHSHSACLSAVKEADYLLLLIGKRRGGTFIGSEASITNEEYNAALAQGIPCIVCVDKTVNDYRRTFKRNPSSDHAHIVEDVRVFHFIDYVSSGHSDNWLHLYSSVKDLRKILTAQLAHYLWMFSRNQRPNQSQTPQEVLVLPFPDSLPALAKLYKGQVEQTAMRNGLFELHRLVNSIQTSDTKADAKLEKLKQLWIVARYGELSDMGNGDTLRMDADNFAQYAWSATRGKRVNAQFKDFGVQAVYDLNADETGANLEIRFLASDEEKPIAWTLQEYVKQLLKTHPEKEAFELFKRFDVQCFR
jgi:hypothetical protein